MDLFKQFFWNNPIKGDNINKNCFSAQNEPHTAKLCFSVVLKHFCGNSLKTSLFSQKVTISERSSEIVRKFAFLNKIEKGQIQRKIWICCKQFLFKALKRDKYKKNCFSPQNKPHTTK